MAESLIGQINTSETREDIKKETRDVFNNADKIIKHYEKVAGKSSPEYQRVKKEYEEVRKIIGLSIQNDRKITQTELQALKKELGDLRKYDKRGAWEIFDNTSFHISDNISNAGENIKKFGIGAEKQAIGSIINNSLLVINTLKLRGINTTSLEQKIKKEGYTDKIKLEITYQFKNIRAGDRGLNKLQEELINKILGPGSYGRGNGKGYIVGYNNQKGNYIQAINEFEKNLKNTKNISKINSLALANYITIKNFNYNDIIQVFGINNLKNLNQIWIDNEENKKALSILKERGLENKINLIKSVGEKLKTSNGAGILNNIKNLKGEEIGIGISLLKANYDGILNNIRLYLSNKIKDKNKINIIMTEIKNIRNKTNLEAVITKINSFGLNGEDTKIIAKKTIEIGKREEEINYLRKKQELEIKRKTGNPEEIKKAEENLEKELFKIELQHEKNKEILKKLSPKDIEKISKKGSLEKIVEEKRKIDKEFDKKMKTYEKKEKELPLKYEKGQRIPISTNNIGPRQRFLQPIEGGQYNITTSDGKTIVPKITEKEAQEIKNNPEVAKNIINFYRFFKKINLLSAWEYRNEIITSIGKISVNKDDNFLDKDELLRFGNTIITFINKTFIINGDNKKISKSENLNQLRENLKSFSGANNILSKNRTSSRGKDPLEETLRHSDIISEIGEFKKLKFREYV